MSDSGYHRLLSDLFTDRGKNVYIVYGALGSGKSHFVEEHITSKDIVFDLDRIAAAVSMDNNLYGNREAQLNVVLAMRETFFERIEKRYGNLQNAYIISAEKDKSKIYKLAEHLGAETIEMETDIASCISNIRNDTRRKGYHEKFIALR